MIYSATMFVPFPMDDRRINATEAVLERIYNAARIGLTDDALAYGARLRPEELRALRLADQIVEDTILRARVEGEIEASDTLWRAAKTGDTSAAMNLLKHKFDWVTKQQIDVNVDQRISITQALAQARTRVIEAIYEEIHDEPNLLENTENTIGRRNGSAED